MIYNIVVLCSLNHTQMLVGELQEQLTAEYSGIAYVTDQGFTYTKRHGFLVIEWHSDVLSEDLLSQLEQDERAKDVIPYTLSYNEDEAVLLGTIIAQDQWEAQL
jgi:predicted NUDIX family phosphoesterase